jgi:LmbE family N-acetylglucosaminyl deacetylase
MRARLVCAGLLGCACVFAGPRPVHAHEPKLKVMMIFAHPDEGEIYTGGTAILYTQMGHTVKFLSITNGDAGHYSMKPEDLAKRRYQEAMEAKRIIGLADYEVLGYHDGNLQDTSALRANVAERIQDFQPDVIFSYYSADGGHNDNMSAGRIVRGAVPLLKMAKMPVVFYVRDYFTTRLSHVPHVAISIDSVWETKLRACGAHESQVLESNPHSLGILAEVQASKERARDYLYHNTHDYSQVTTDILLTLEKWYGRQTASTVKYAEAFEIAEYGRQVREDEVRQLMPMLRGMLTVPGRTRWLDTVIDVTRGQPIEIAAEGSVQWNEDGHQFTGPTGASAFTRSGNKPMPGISTGALIGKIGADSTEYFYVGSGMTVIPFATGRLFVGVNDDNVDDNGGAFRIWVRPVKGN